LCRQMSQIDHDGGFCAITPGLVDRISSDYRMHAAYCTAREQK
jgi:hypothetical protein